MEDQQKRLWQKPEVIIISANRDINGGATANYQEGGPVGGQFYISTANHGGLRTVGSATYNNAHS